MNVFEKIIEQVEKYLQSEKEFTKIVDIGNAVCNPVLSRTIGRIKAYESIKEIINQVAEEHNNGWIPCSERLPEIYEDCNTSDVVLVCCSNSCQYMAFWCGDLRWRFCECGTAKEPIHWTDIIAWQPLPEPYKERE